MSEGKSKGPRRVARRFIGSERLGVTRGGLAQYKIPDEVIVTIESSGKLR
jgi:hypothetical protein